MSWGKGNAYHCSRVRGYPEAVRHFDQRGPVKSKRWQNHERPLISTTEVWYKNVKGLGPDDYYELVYGRDTPVIRYFKPEENGDYRVWLALAGWGSRNAWNFLDIHGWGWNKRYDTTCEQKVMTPLHSVAKEAYQGIPAGWHSCLTFNKSGLLILEKSNHRPAYTRKSSAGDKEARSGARRALDTTLDLLVLRTPSFHASAEVSSRMGRAFGGLSTWSFRHLEEAVAGAVATGEVDDELLEILLPFAQQVYNVSLSKVWYTAERSYVSGNDLVLMPEVASEKFRKALQGALLRHSGLMKPHENVELPKFLTELPKKWFSSKV